MDSEFIEGFISNDNKLSFIDHGSYESRSESTIALFNEAFEQVKDKALLTHQHFYVDLHDIGTQINDELTFGYTPGDGVVVCPDFTFDRWVECHIDNYEATVNRILDQGEKSYTIEKMFWMGNLNTQQLRYDLVELGALHTDKLEFIPMEWVRYSPKGSMHYFTNYTSLEDHTKYKYLIDSGAQGFSARPKFLLHTNRPLFLVDREECKREYFYNWLVPYEHFIPVKDDLSDLLVQLEWAENNYAEATRIAGNARQFAIDNLNKKTVIDYLTEAIQKSCYSPQ